MTIRCSCGRSFDAAVDPTIPEVAVRCPSCGQTLRVVNRKAAQAAAAPADVVATKLRRYEVLSGVLWLVVGALQVAFLYTAAAGVWNIVNAIIRLRSVKNIRAGNPEVVPWYDGRKTSLIIFAVVNIVLGAAVGVVLVLFDCWVRNYALKNKGAFTGVSVASGGK